ncbi:FitA-like ribbon-helix-helix domain-containing protein [Goodfellowiella coeruleoviolacea]|uniref:Antitoxin FitA-like ribbon-helix-helix domain-containing protein n=1 Tax=Goodfellowiella coeruleoviolacea TaxID=334858 RepID=A0AAE3GFW5_9PSEU|nr:hypothetical protein [Goodfellowiella coeruleoviolacea]MCP2166614.1 hypothetical protein [Goodfellowiella coeruleoviolacea]
MGKVIQIRDVDDATYTALRTKASAEHLSLNAYLRRELARLAEKPSMAEWIRAATDRDWGVSRDTVVGTLREIRDEGGEDQTT